MSILPTHWYYNTETGQLTQGNNLENLGNNLFGGMGWHELHIPGSATAAQATAEAKKEFPDGTPPTTAGITPKRVLDNAVNQATGNNKGSQGGPWWENLLQVGEILLGLLLIAVGVAKMTNAVPAATMVARAVS